MNSALAIEIQSILSRFIGTNIRSVEMSPIGGGSINDTYQIRINNRLKFFCKINGKTKFPGLFEKEKAGLELLDSSQIIRVPKIIACDFTEQNQVLILEWIEQGMKTEKFWLGFGEQLAKQHQLSNSLFGLKENNYMGALSQSNQQSGDWIQFLILERFQPQIELAVEKKLLEPSHIAHFNNLYKKLNEIFPPEKPSLLHGDLWSGNFLCDKNNQPVLIDPAVYFGHRSMDLAMTTLFGGFEDAFYQSYHQHFPFPGNYRVQWQICNLYPLLIHLNLFGPAYLSEIINTIRHY